MSRVGVPDEFAELAALLESAQADADRAALESLDPEVIAARRRQRRRRRRNGAIALTLVVAAVGTYVPVVLLAPTITVTATVKEPRVAQPEAVTLVLPDVGASAVSLIGAEHFDGTAGVDGILAASGGTDARPIASITKLITALVILDARPLGDTDAGPTITFRKADADLYDKYYVMNATVQPMRTGSAMSQRDALTTMLVASATNYAEAVSTWAFGSQANFRNAARSWLAANGLDGTTIVEPTGIDPRNVSTPADLLAIGKLALANPIISTIVRSPVREVPNLGALQNTNRLLGIDGITGIKTGTLDEAGSCLLFSAVLHIGASAPVTVLGVVLGGEHHQAVNAATQALLASIKSGFREVPLTAEGDLFGSYQTPWGGHADIRAARGATALVWSDATASATVDTRPITTATGGSEVGTVTLVAGRDTVTVPLVLDGDIEGPDAWWRLTHPAEMLASRRSPTG